MLYCKTGVRSAEVLAAVRGAGFADAVHLQGGIVAWAQQIAARHGDVLTGDEAATSCRSPGTSLSPIRLAA